jgi:hypothetical protein
MDKDMKETLSAKKIIHNHGGDLDLLSLISLTLLLPRLVDLDRLLLYLEYEEYDLDRDREREIDLVLDRLDRTE